MIVKMKQITLLCQAHDRERTLEELRDIGVLHLVPVQEPTGDNLAALRMRIDSADAAASALKLYAHDHHSGHTAGQHPAMSAQEIVKKVSAILHKISELEDQDEVLQHDISLVEHFGDFDPNVIRSLSEKGIYVRLFSASPKHAIEVPENASVKVLKSDARGIHFVVTSTSAFDMDAHELQLPVKSLSELRRDHKELEKAIQTAKSELHDLSSEYRSVKSHKHELEEELVLVTARDGMGRDRSVSYLKGFCPEDRVDELRSVLDSHGWGLVVQEPADDKPVPTLVRYPGFVKPIKAVFDVLQILPGYHEADISMAFLVFFSIFFAMLIGDAGYGLLFLLATVFASRKMKKAPRYPFTLFGILSIATIVWGVATANYFGIQPELLPEFLRGLSCSWLTSAESGQSNIMKTCFLLGAIHLTLAHIWNAVVVFPNKKWMAQAGWMGLVWCMFYGARHYVLGDVYPPWILYLFLPSIALVVVFMTPRERMKTEWIHHAMLPLSVINCFVDIVSYIRLFAVGMASAKVAMSVNLAFQLDASKIWTVPVIAAILIAGHTLNIVLCALGILVHGVRLNTLEFSLHRNMEWSGFAYNPLRQNMNKTK